MVGGTGHARKWIGAILTLVESALDRMAMQLVD